MTAARRHALALALAQLRGMIRVSGLRPAIKGEAQAILSAAIHELTADPAPPACAEAPGRRPYWLED